MIDTEKNTTKKNQSSLTHSVLERITREHVTPRSKLLCRCIAWSMWGMWAVMIFVGAVVFSQVVYVCLHSGIEFYKFTHDSFRLFLWSSLPIIWIGILCVFTVLAMYHLKLTKRGYRYTLLYITGISLVCTVMLGLVFNMFGVGKQIDMFLDTMPMPYESMEDRQLYLWTHPEDGRLAGMMIGFVGSTTDIVFKDVQDREWTVVTTELSEADFDLLVSGVWVRIFGTVDDMQDTYLFYVCSVHEWMYDDDMPFTPMKENKMRLYKNQAFHEDKARSDESEKMRCMNIIADLMPE